MSTNYTTDKPRRSPRGGRRRSRRGSSNNSNSTDRDSADSGRPRRTAESRQPKKLTFWQKVVAFFTGGEPERKAPERRQPSPSHAAAAVEKPARAEREPRANRTGMRKPELIEVTTPRLYVGNLSFDAVESDLLDLFNGVGIVQNVEVVSNRQTQRSKGFAFVQMQTVEEAKRAVSELHDKEYMGRKLVVSGAKASDRPEREAASEQPEQ